jgi:hypothetical protein
MDITWSHAVYFSIGLIAAYYVVAHYKKTGQSY